MLVVYVRSIYRDTLPTTLLATPDTSQSCFEFFFSLKLIFFNSIYWQGFFFFFLGSELCDFLGVFFHM